MNIFSGLFKTRDAPKTELVVVHTRFLWERVPLGKM